MYITTYLRTILIVMNDTELNSSLSNKVRSLEGTTHATLKKRTQRGIYR